jgi:hypothetical protein
VLPGQVLPLTPARLVVDGPEVAGNRRTGSACTRTRMAINLTVSQAVRRAGASDAVGLVAHGTRRKARSLMWSGA